MILSAKYARENRIPYFGICLGMQIAVIEFARHVLGLTDAHSGEFDEQCAHRVIDFMPGQSGEIDKGGTLRLGSYPCCIKAGTKWKSATYQNRSMSVTATVMSLIMNIAGAGESWTGHKRNFSRRQAG